MTPQLALRRRLVLPALAAALTVAVLPAASASASSASHGVDAKVATRTAGRAAGATASKPTKKNSRNAKPSERDVFVPNPKYRELNVAAEQVWRAINASRAKAGLPPLHRDHRLRQSANVHDVNMAHADEMSHQLPGEANFAVRISDQGVPWVVAEENIGWNSDVSNDGVPGTLYLHKIMMAEGKPPAGQDNHYSNIMSTEVTRVGVDVIYDRVNQKLWLTEDFARE